MTAAETAPETMVEPGARAETRQHRELLDLRSAALAGRGRDGRGQDGRGNEVVRQAFLVCACGQERYGLPLGALAAVLTDRPCTPVPGATTALRGVIAHAGAIVSVIDLGRALGLDGDPPDGTGHLVRLRAQEPAVALAVDRVLGLAEVVPEAITAAAGPESVAGLGTEPVSGYCPARSDAGTGVRDGFAVVDLPGLLRPFLT